jgi:hypothetical protein
MKDSSAKYDEKKKLKETTSLNAYFFSFDVYILHGLVDEGTVVRIKCDSMSHLERNPKILLPQTSRPQSQAALSSLRAKVASGWAETVVCSLLVPSNGPSKTEGIAENNDFPCCALFSPYD